MKSDVTGRGRGGSRHQAASSLTHKKKIATTYRMPSRMKDEILKRVIADGYGMKGKSRWIEEAITDFLSERSWKDQVIDLDMITGNDGKDVAYLDRGVKDELDKATLTVKNYAQESIDSGQRCEAVESLNITVSLIIRSAITWRMFSLKMPIIELNQELDLQKRL